MKEKKELLRGLMLRLLKDALAAQEAAREVSKPEKESSEALDLTAPDIRFLRNSGIGVELTTTARLVLVRRDDPTQRIELVKFQELGGYWFGVSSQMIQNRRMPTVFPKKGRSENGVSTDSPRTLGVQKLRRSKKVIPQLPGSAYSQMSL